MSNWKFNRPVPRIGDVVYFYNEATRVEKPPFGHVTSHDGNGILTIFLGANESKPRRRNVRHVSDPKLKEFPQIAMREGCWVTPDEHYAWLEDTRVASRHVEGKTPTEIADALGEAYTPQKVGAILKRLGLEPHKKQEAVAVA